MSMAWVAAGTAVLGAAASIYGSNQQKKANAAAQDQNIAQQDKINNAAWTNWLMTRGVAPTSPITAGQMPSSYAAVNTRLPLWASINQPTGPSRWQKVGANYGKPNTLAVTAPIGAAGTTGADAATAPVGSATAATPSAGQKLANILDPLNVTVGKNKNPVERVLDPLGIFG